MVLFCCRGYFFVVAVVKTTRSHPRCEPERLVSLQQCGREEQKERGGKSLHKLIRCFIRTGVCSHFFLACVRACVRAYACRSVCVCVFLFPGGEVGIWAVNGVKLQNRELVVAADISHPVPGHRRTQAGGRSRGPLQGPPAPPPSHTKSGLWTRISHTEALI